MTSKTLWLFFIIIFSFSLLPVWAQKELRIENKKGFDIPVSNIIKGGVSESKELPDEFYGTWQVKGTLIHSDNFDLFKLKTSDTWALKKNNNIITLTNPATGASSSITIDKIKDKTATFSRKKVTTQKKESESVEITVNGDIFYGTDEFVIEQYKNGVLLMQTNVKYNIVGQKVNDNSY
ncbi:MAG: hypothetical protein WC197_00310 [Candidatus Gastranaerophilaceae bacterium]|jgi:hypothetical protein